LSYSVADAALANQLTAALRAQNVDVVDANDIPSGLSWSSWLEEQARRRSLVVLVSDKASPWVDKETEIFAAHKSRVVPVVIGDFATPTVTALNDRQALRIKPGESPDAIARRLSRFVA
jgi:hypothetical protein